MGTLEHWLKQATAHLSKDSAARVRSEVMEHYALGREAAISGGATVEEAEAAAVVALGDARAVNCQYRRVLLTSAEAKMLHAGNREAGAICSRPWLKWLLVAVPAIMLLASAAFFLAGATANARVLFAGGIVMSLPCVAPFLPIYKASRARIFRRLKWMLLTGALVLAFRQDALRLSWLLACSLWPLIYIECTRISIRRKLPVAAWPKQLYL